MREPYPLFTFMEGCYNPHRRHSALSYLSPIDNEGSPSPPTKSQAHNRPPNQRKSGGSLNVPNGSAPSHQTDSAIDSHSSYTRRHAELRGSRYALYRRSAYQGRT